MQTNIRQYALAMGLLVVAGAAISESVKYPVNWKGLLETSLSEPRNSSTYMRNCSLKVI